MIPVRLQLRNFMSYGEGVPPLDFVGIRLACLSGDNGNGKTALLDAITWALFDKTRAKERDGVIRLGASEAGVIFDFMVENMKYRVRRSLGRKGGSLWELQVWQEDGSTRPLTGVNNRETGDQIRKLLKMDYDTFLATGYLAQGRADEFTRATGSGRKKILADILGLERFERLKDLANERRKEAETNEKDAENELRGIDEKLSRRDYFEDQKAQAEQRLQLAVEARDAVRVEQEDLLAQIERLESEEEKARDWEMRSAEVEREIGDYRRDIQEIEGRIRQAQTLVDRRVEIEDSYCRHEALTEESQRLEEQYDQVLALEREAGELDKRIQDEFRQLDNERYRLETEISTLDRESQELARFEGDITHIEREISDFGDPMALREEAEGKRVQAEEELLRLRTQHAERKSGTEVIDKRITALSGSDSAICDYCGQALPPDRRQKAIAEAQTERDRLAAEMQDLAAEGKDCRRQAEDFRKQAEQAQNDLVAMERLRTRLGQLTQHRMRIEERLKAVPEMRRRHERFVQRLSERDFAQKEQERRVQIAALLEKLERVGQRRSDVRTELERYKGIPVEMERLRQADADMQTYPPRIAELTERIAKKEETIARAQKKIAEVRARTVALPTLYREQQTLNLRMQEVEGEVNATTRTIGELTRELEHCKRLAEERVRREAERLQAHREKDQFKELTAAFSDKGVQALIIGNALPELQNQTNDLLARMTNGAMQVQMVLQREAKTKGANPIETLDIIISDDLGSRPYEMFSGGEAFRINFALRVALSKMLAQRAGAPLQTLILDEGFGTQDPRGREAIADAINLIADDFALVLVITHVEELKESFPTRIEVTKGPNGSTYAVV